MRSISFYLLPFLLLITACSIGTDLKQQTANHIARPAFMVERKVSAGNFQLQAWERMHARNQVATIYIEGEDAKAGKAHSAPSRKLLPANSTPKTPVALHLASRDQSKNVAYLGRPCQFIKNPEAKGCAAAYWNEKRFAPEVMNAYEAALDDIAARYDITAFHIIGHGGGGNIAAVLAARRTDILTLRTVASDLNPDFENHKNNRLALAPNSVLAIDYGTALGNVPQHHFIGAADDVITPGNYHSFRQALGLSECIHYSLVQDADHTNGWTEKWPELLALQPQCASVHTPVAPLPPSGDFPNQDRYKGPRFSK